MQAWTAKYRAPGGMSGVTSFYTYGAAVGWLAAHSKRLGCGDVSTRFPFRMASASYMIDDPHGYSFSVENTAHEEIEHEPDEASDYDPVREHGTYHARNGSVVG